MDNIVGLEHEGTPIYLIIHKSFFPKYNTSTLIKVQNLIFNATKEYYEANTIRGCTDPTAKNFDYEVLCFLILSMLPTHRLGVLCRTLINTIL